MPPDWLMAGPFSTAITTLLASARDCRRAASFGVPSTTPRSCPSPEMSRSPTTISGCLCRHEHNCWLPIGPCVFWSTGVLLRGAYSEIAGCPSVHACACSGTAWVAAGSESLDAPVSCVVGGFGDYLRLLANWHPRERGASQLMPGVANPARAGWLPGSGRLTLPPCPGGGTSAAAQWSSRQVLRRRAAVADRVLGTQHQENSWLSWLRVRHRAVHCFGWPNGW